MLVDLNPGDTLLRRAVHARYGGNQQGGITTSRKITDVVLFFTDPAKGHRHGYYDGWGTDGCFHYVGEGQQGDQRLVRGNQRILNHYGEGRTLEGFRADGRSVTYLGEFDLVGHYFTDAHETNDVEALRQVVVFRLRPRSSVPVELPKVPLSPVSAARAEVVPVEERHTERAFVSPDREPYRLERREAELVQRYSQSLVDQGHEAGRLQIVPPGESRPLYSDVWDKTTNELVEAKSSVTRDQLRTAVGQLLDYGRFIEAERWTVLVPLRPRADMLDYLHRYGIGVVYPNGNNWSRLEPESPDPLGPVQIRYI
ncbi:restriction endonuclease [Halosaccharopolyspora lacisalsi]|uniref:restriction endonuclease n=1 Tax=Halosaccharopolyspora lacisalsi TaxID=1000566 RepID=UPI0015F9A29B|nr:restriction endonuclease [Halosaccharopolyspora lacisalsi]